MCDSGTDYTKVRVYKIRPDWANDWLVCEQWGLVQTELENADEGDRWEIEPVIMTRHELDNLKEHEGW